MNMKLAWLAFLAGATLTSLPTTVDAQKARKGIVSRAAQSRGGATDQNIKNTEATNRKDETIAAPPRKGGAKTRGAAVGSLRVDNRTGFYIYLYADGEFVGLVAPYGDWYGNGKCESYTLYAIAKFDDGSALTWGPTSTNSGCGSDTWTLRL